VSNKFTYLLTYLLIYSFTQTHSTNNDAADSVSGKPETAEQDRAG